ncbi:MAG: GNAT family N-acetyltransferase [Candidatus Scalindua sp.]
MNKTLDIIKDDRNNSGEAQSLIAPSAQYLEAEKPKPGDVLNRVGESIKDTNQQKEVRLIQRETTPDDFAMIQGKFNSTDWYMPIYTYARPIGEGALSQVLKALDWDGHSYKVEGSDVIGTIGLINRNSRKQAADILPVFFVSKENQNRVAVINQFVDWSFFEMGIRKLKVFLLEHDIMVKEFISCGFKEEGMLYEEVPVRDKLYSVKILSKIRK